VTAIAKLTLAVALAIALTGLLEFSGSAGAAPAKAKNACGLLEKSEIKAQFEGDISKPVSGPGPGCTWEIVVGGDPAAVGSGTVGTFLLRTQAKAAFEVGRQTDPDTTDIEGLGKDAYYAPGSGTIYVLKNSKTVYFVQGVFIGENVGRDQDAVPDLEAKLTKLAKKAQKQA
jgi:hypothetical protein